MVEGSRVDMAAHAKDPVGVITEMLAFDKAVGVALDFARRDGRTAVVIMPDHGTSGLSFGDGAYKDYASKGLDSAYMNISKVRRTASGLEKYCSRRGRNRSGPCSANTRASSLRTMNWPCSGVRAIIPRPTT